MTVAIAVAVLVAGGIYLILQRGVVRLIFGAILISHAVNLVLMSSGGIFHRAEPLVRPGAEPSRFADPLPQAFVLTAIVIFFGTSIYLFSLAVAGPSERVLEQEAAGSDEDPEDAEPHTLLARPSRSGPRGPRAEPAAEEDG